MAGRMSVMSWTCDPYYGIYIFVIMGLSIVSCGAQNDKIMACYLGPGMAQNFSGSSVDPYLCTHVICAGGVVTPDGIETQYAIDMEQFRAVAGLKAKNPNLKVMVSLQHGFASVVDQHTEFASERFALKAVIFLEKLNMDGIDLDWEFPEAFEKIAYINFIKILAAYLNSSNLLLSMALPASPFRVDNGYDIPTINRYIDFFTIMNYDYHEYNKETDTVTGYNSPLYTPEGELPYLSTAESLTYFLYKGMSKEKMLMGIPTYGRSWTLTNPDKHGLHSPANNSGPPAPYSSITGSYLFPDVCTAQKQGATTVKDEVNVGEYLYNDTTWVAFESKYSIFIKMEWLKRRELAGVGIWDYQADDLYNVCGYGHMPLLNYLKSQLQPRTLIFTSEN